MRKISTFLLLGLSASVSGIETRDYEPLILQGSAIPAALGKAVGEIQLFRFVSAGGTWEPVPFQIDEKDGESGFFGARNGVLDAADEIVFIARDLGDRAAASLWIEDENSRTQKRIEIAVHDPLDASIRGYAYLFFTPGPARSTFQYMEYDAAKDRVVSEIYDLRHGTHGLADSLAIRPEAGGDGIDLLDRQKFRLKLRISIGGLSDDVVLAEDTDKEFNLFKLYPIRFRVSRKRADVIPNHNVRVLRQIVLEIYAKSADLEYIDSLRFTTSYYPVFSEFSTGILKVPQMEYGGVRGRVDMVLISTDLNRNAKSMRFMNPYNADGSIVVDAIPDAGILKDLVWPGDNWHLIVADPAAAGVFTFQASLLTLTRTRRQAPGSSRELYYLDSFLPNAGDTGDGVSWGDTGFKISGSIESDSIDVSQYFYYLPQNLTYSGAEQAFNQHFHPLEAAIGSQKYAYPVVLDSDPPDAGIVLVTPSPDSAFFGYTLTATALPGPMYAFDHWSGDITGAANPDTFFVDGPTHITAHFLKLPAITVDTDPPGIPFHVDGQDFGGEQTFYWQTGETHQLCCDSIYPVGTHTRAVFTDWNGASGLCLEYTVPDQDDFLIGRYIAQYRLIRYVQPAGLGSITADPEGEWFNKGTELAVTAVPNPNVSFIQWKGNLSGTENPTMLVMDGPRTIRAQFGNLPPLVHVPDTSFAEDDSLLLSYDLLDEWIEDPDDPDSVMHRSLSGSDLLHVVHDSLNHRFLIKPAATDWNGLDTLFITVISPDGASASDSFLVTVTPVPDPPGSFHLLDPADETIVSEWPQHIVFDWENSEDPDLDPVIYRFELDSTPLFNSPLYILKHTITDSRYILVWPEGYINRTYYWRVWADDSTGRSTGSSETFHFSLATGVSDRDAGVPDAFVLAPNVPNPFNSSTLIRFGLPVESDIKLLVVNEQGKLTGSLDAGRKKAGYHTVSWDGKNHNGLPLSSGIYFIVLQAGHTTVIRKTMLIR